MVGLSDVFTSRVLYTNINYDMHVYCARANSRGKPLEQCHNRYISAVESNRQIIPIPKYSYCIALFFLQERFPNPSLIIMNHHHLYSLSNYTYSTVCYKYQCSIDSEQEDTAYYW